jgi:hypothetical protein
VAASTDHSEQKKKSKLKSTLNAFINIFKDDIHKQPLITKDMMKPDYPDYALDKYGKKIVHTVGINITGSTSIVDDYICTNNNRHISFVNITDKQLTIPFIMVMNKEGIEGASS